MLSSLNELAEGQSGRGEAGCWNEMCLPIFTAIPGCSLRVIYCNYSKAFWQMEKLLSHLEYCFLPKKSRDSMVWWRYQSYKNRVGGSSRKHGRETWQLLAEKMQVYIRVTPVSGGAQEASQQPRRPHGSRMWFTLLEVKSGYSGDLTSYFLRIKLLLASTSTWPAYVVSCIQNWIGLF